MTRLACSLQHSSLACPTRTPPLPRPYDATEADLLWVGTPVASGTGLLVITGHDDASAYADGDPSAWPLPRAAISGSASTRAPGLDRGRYNWCRGRSAEAPNNRFGVVVERLLGEARESAGRDVDCGARREQRASRLTSAIGSSLPSTGPRGRERSRAPASACTSAGGSPSSTTGGCGWGTAPTPGASSRWRCRSPSRQPRAVPWATVSL